MHERKIRRLAKPMKTGLLHLIFSRFLVIILLLGLQVAIFAGFYGWLSKLTHYMAALQLVFTALMVIYLFNNSMDSSAKLTWMFLIALFPLHASLYADESRPPCSEGESGFSPGEDKVSA